MRLPRVNPGRRARRAAPCVLLWVALLLAAGCAAPTPGGTIAALTLARSTASWDGRTLPAYPAGQPQVTILRIAIPPGTALPLHRHPFINAGVLLRGELTVVKQDGATLRLREGEAVVEVVDAWHFGRNDGRVPAEIIVFYAGTADAPVSLYPDPASP